MYWTFKCFTTVEAELHAWYQGLNPRDQSRVDSVLDHLRQNPKERWADTRWFSPLAGPCAGLDELRFKFNNIQYRPIGFFGPARAEFTFVFFGVEKGGRWVNGETCRAALANKDRAITNPHLCQEWPNDE